MPHSPSKRIVVTGGHGFIGHHLVRRLLDQGHDVLVIDNHFRYSNVSREEYGALLDARLQHTGRHQRVERATYYRDLKEHTEYWGKEVDAIVHLANLPRQAEATLYPELTVRNNSFALPSLLEAFPNPGHYVMISTSMVYGDFNEPVDESVLPQPKGTYGALRLAAEYQTQWLCKQRDIPYTIVRPSAVYGPRDSSVRVVGKFVSQALEDEALVVRGENEVMDFTHVNDLVEGLMCVLRVGGENEVYNLTRGIETFTLRDLAQLVINKVGQGRIELQPSDNSMPSRHILDITKARERLGYCPIIPLPVGLDSIVEDLVNRKIKLRAIA